MKRYFAIERNRGPRWRQDLPMPAQARWDEHATFMNGLAASGKIVLGGPIGTEGEILLIADVATEKEARAMFDPDPWTGMGLLIMSRVRKWEILLDSSEV